MIVPPGASVTVTFAPNSAGLFQFTWDKSAAAGTVSSGDFLLDVTWYTGDPRACNFTCKVANPLQTEAQSSYSVTLGGQGQHCSLTFVAQAVKPAEPRVISAFLGVLDQR